MILWILFIKNLRKLSDAQRSDPIIIVSYWRSEVFASIGEQIPRLTDYSWLESYMSDLIKEVNIFIFLKFYLNSYTN